MADPFPYWSPTTNAALVAAGALVLGWGVTWWLGRHNERSQRIERIRDTKAALIAEIENNINRSSLPGRHGERIPFDFDKDFQSIEQKMLAGRYLPFVPRYSSTMVFDQVKTEIPILPTSCIGPVIAYYKHEQRIQLLTEDMRTDHFAKTSVFQKIAILRDYYEMLKHSVSLGEDAIRSIKDSANAP